MNRSQALQTLIIKNTALKKLLELFEGHDNLFVKELGDTWHPDNGFVDESYFKNIQTIDDLRAIDYDFKGLVVFEAQIRDLKIQYKSDTNEFILTGNESEIKEISKRYRQP